MTSSPPTPRIIFCSHGKASIRAPAPRKQAIPRDMSQNIIIKTVAITRLSFWVIALLITNKFCIPIGATYANPKDSP